MEKNNQVCTTIFDFDIFRIFCVDSTVIMILYLMHRYLGWKEWIEKRRDFDEKRNEYRTSTLLSDSPQFSWLVTSVGLANIVFIHFTISKFDSTFFM